MSPKHSDRCNISSFITLNKQLLNSSELLWATSWSHNHSNLQQSSTWFNVTSSWVKQVLLFLDIARFTKATLLPMFRQNVWKNSLLAALIKKNTHIPPEMPITAVLTAIKWVWRSLPVNCTSSHILSMLLTLNILLHFRIKDSYKWFIKWPAIWWTVWSACSTCFGPEKAVRQRGWRFLVCRSFQIDWFCPFCGKRCNQFQ